MSLLMQDSRFQLSLAINLEGKSLDQILRSNSLPVQDLKQNFQFSIRCRTCLLLFLTNTTESNQVLKFCAKQVDVNGPNTAPIYQFLKSSAGGFFGDLIKWNFEKFLVNKNGKVVERYPPTTSPFQIEVQVFIYFSIPFTLKLFTRKEIFSCLTKKV